MRAWILLIGLVWTVLAAAQMPSAMQAYEARVPVANQSPAERDRALREALREVVARITGDAIPGEQAQSVIDQAARLVQRYGYAREPDGSLVLIAGFDGRAVEARLKALGLPVWGVYAAAIEDVQMQIAGITDAAAYARALEALRSVPAVRSVQAVRANGDRLELHLRVEGGASRLVGALSATATFVQDPSGTSELSYRLVR